MIQFHISRQWQTSVSPLDGTCGDPDHTIQESPKTTFTVSINTIQYTPGTEEVKKHFLNGIIQMLQKRQSAPPSRQIGPNWTKVLTGKLVTC